MEEKEVDSMRDEFKAVLLLILNMLERGETDRAIDAIREILSK